MDLRYAYLHGFGSSRDSRKGTELQAVFREHGVDLRLLDLNVPSFREHTYSSILGLLDTLDAEAGGGFRWRLVGSSMGGYLAARWAELNPERVDRLFLLCPGFDLQSRWSIFLGDDEMKRWETEGVLEVDTVSGGKQLLDWTFVEDSVTHPAYPEVPCPTRIVHGIRDDVVPLEFSRRYVRERGHVELVEVDDDHLLANTGERIAAEVLSFFEIES